MNKKDLTDFEKLVYEKVKQIPKGKISTYKLVAEAIGKPKACRAVGTALKNNPFAPIVPCHRVLPSDYTIGGFFGDTNKNSDNVKKKIKLLESEGIKFDKSTKYEVLRDDEYKNKITHNFK